MKSIFTYIVLFLGLLLCVNCAKNNKTPDATDAKKQLEKTDSMVNDTALQELETAKAQIPSIYICYTNDDESSIQLSIAFNEDGNALFVKYKGQKDSIPLHNIKEDYQGDGAYPTITQFYDEMLNGSKKGTYELTHSGNWDYAVYRPVEKDTMFKFTIHHEMTVVNGDYRKTPCF